MLTCTDQYLKHRTWMIGKESHYQDERWDLYSIKKIYLKDVWYTYDDNILNNKAYNTEFLKTRKIIAGCDPYDSSPKCMGALINNLNKVSLQGNYTPVEDRFREIYEPFEYNGKKLNVFQHELLILQPQKIVCCCGKGYNEHITRAFGKKALERIVATKDYMEYGIKEDKKQCICVTFNKDELVKGLGKIEFMLAIHPSARMRKNVREKYNKTIRKYVE